MNTPTLIQEAIEQQAREKINRDVEALKRDFRDLIQKHGHICSAVSIEIVSNDGRKSRPYLSQIFDCEAVQIAIRSQHMDKFIRIEINKLLNKVDS